MKAHLVQFDITWEDRAANHDKVERLLGKADVQQGDLVVLPEMFDSGFSLNTERTADKEGATLKFLVRLAEDFGVTIHGARTVHDCHCTHAENRAPVISPAGDVIAEYAKIHPFSYGREGEKFTGGRDVMTYTWKAGETSLTVCPAICYDLRFPELFRLGLLKGAEAIAIGANWPEARQAHWRALLVARAIENQSFVFGVNRTGRDPNLAYIGGSIALGPKGELLGELGAEEKVLTVEVDPREVRAWREKFPAWRDTKLMRGERVGG
jgi:predicted amidohydrolase